MTTTNTQQMKTMMTVQVVSTTDDRVVVREYTTGRTVSYGAVEFVELEQDLMGVAVIGAKGAKLAKLRALDGISKVVPTPAKQRPRKDKHGKLLQPRHGVELFGSAKGVAAAKKMIAAAAAQATDNHMAWSEVAGSEAASEVSEPPVVVPGWVCDGPDGSDTVIKAGPYLAAASGMATTPLPPHTATPEKQTAKPKQPPKQPPQPKQPKQPAAAIATKEQQPPPAQAQDVVEKMAVLVQARTMGLLTESEFAAKAAALFSSSITPGEDGPSNAGAVAKPMSKNQKRRQQRNRAAAAKRDRAAADATQPNAGGGSGGQADSTAAASPQEALNWADTS